MPLALIALDIVAKCHNYSAVDHSTIIDSLGGASVVSAALGIQASNTVTYWKRRGIPPLYWGDVAKLAAEKSLAISVEDLRATSKRRRIAA